MKPVTTMKMEGDKLKFEVSQSVAVDTDKDGEAALKGAVALQLEVDGGEALAELMKSSAIAQKAKALLIKLGLVKEDVVDVTPQVAE